MQPKTKKPAPAVKFPKTRWQERRDERRKAIPTGNRALAGPLRAPPQAPTLGTFVGLCLLIKFPGETPAITKAEVEAFCNKKGYTGFGNNGSVRDYFADVSDQKMDYTNIVAPYYTAKKPKSYYADPTAVYAERAQELIVEALKFHLAAKFDFSKLTVDSKGFVHAINVFYAGECENEWSEGLWPHASTLTKIKLARGKYSGDYQITDMGDELTLGTFCHENGHMTCDFPDLYDYSTAKTGGESRGVGVFCLMCYGTANAKNPAQVGAYLKNAAGWHSKLNTLSPGAKVELRAGRNEFAILRRNPREYFIVENRNRAGRDVSLPGSGLAIWHVDEKGNNSNQDMTKALHYECSLEQADGAFQLEKNINIGDAADLFRKNGRDKFSAKTVPGSSWWDATASGLDIFDIGAAGPVMAFRVA